VAARSIRPRRGDPRFLSAGPAIVPLALVAPRAAGEACAGLDVDVVESPDFLDERLLEPPLLLAMSAPVSVDAKRGKTSADRRGRPTADRRPRDEDKIRAARIGGNHESSSHH
jgi:hypothetical protein